MQIVWEMGSSHRTTDQRVAGPVFVCVVPRSHRISMEATCHPTASLPALQLYLIALRLMAGAQQHSCFGHKTQRRCTT